MHHLDQARCGRGTVVTSSVSLAGTEHGEYALRPILHTQHPLPPQLGSSQGLGEAGQYSVAARWSVLGCRRHAREATLGRSRALGYRCVPAIAYSYELSAVGVTTAFASERTCAGRMRRSRKPRRPSRPGRDVRKVRYPQLVGCSRREVAVDPVRWALGCRVGSGRADVPSPPSAA
jgi:hypothetical protein